MTRVTVGGRKVAQIVVKPIQNLTKSSFTKLMVFKRSWTVLEKIKGNTAWHLDHVNFTFNAIFVKLITSHDTFYFYETDEFEWTWYFMPNELNYKSPRSSSASFSEFAELWQHWFISTEWNIAIFAWIGHRCWWRMLETKYVGNKLKMLWHFNVCFENTYSRCYQ